MRRKDLLTSQLMVGRDRIGGELQRHLTHGLADIGWHGDPWLVVYYNKLADSFEVWDETPGHRPYRAVTRPASEIKDPAHAIRQFVKGLRAGNLQVRGVDAVLGDVDRHNAAVERDRANREAEARAEAVDHLAWALRKDLR